LADNPATYVAANDWEVALGQKPVSAIEQFVKDGMLEPADLHALVDYKFKATELKALLKERLKTSGRKNELISRVISNAECLTGSTTTNKAGRLRNCIPSPELVNLDLKTSQSRR
jgi:hypothetical protein